MSEAVKITAIFHLHALRPRLPIFTLWAIKRYNSLLSITLPSVHNIWQKSGIASFSSVDVYLCKCFLQRLLRWYDKLTNLIILIFFRYIATVCVKEALEFYQLVLMFYASAICDVINYCFWSQNKGKISFIWHHTDTIIKHGNTT